MDLTISVQSSGVQRIFDHSVYMYIDYADLGGRVVQGVGLRLLACRICGFESGLGRGCLSVVSVVCCQVEVSASG